MEWSYRNKKIFIIMGAVIVAAVVLGIKFLFPIFAPFIIAYLIAEFLDKPASWLKGKFGGRKSIYGTIILIIMIILLTAGIGVVGYMGLKELKALISNFERNMVFVKQNVARVSFDVDKVFGFKDGSCLSVVELCERQLDNIMKSSDVSKVIGGVVSVSVPVVKNVIAFFANLIICFFSVPFILPNLDKFKRWKRTTVFRREIRVVDKSLSMLVKVYFKVEALIIIINSTIIAIGLAIIGNPYAIVIGVFTGLIDVLPVLGTGTVLLPWSVVMLILKQPWKALMLLVLYVITYFVREIMEAKVLGNRLGISGFTMLVVIFSGIIIYGLLGFVLGPVTYCIIKPLILYLKRIIESGKLNNI